MAAALNISNSAPVDLALEAVLDSDFCFLVFLAGLALGDLGFLDLVGWTKTQEIILRFDLPKTGMGKLLSGGHMRPLKLFNPACRSWRNYINSK